MAIPAYATTLRPGVEGALANEEPVDLISRTVEDAAGIGFGKAVVQGTLDNGCKILAAGGKCLGVTVRQRNVSPYALNGNGFAKYDSARIMVQGVIWVVVSAPVVAGDPATFDNTTGKFSNTGGVAVLNARFDTAAAADGIAQLRLSNVHG